MQTNPSLPEHVIESFHLMWGMFPENVMLVHKSRQVMAINKAAEAMAFIKPGMSCAQIGPPQSHKGCLADKALSSGEAKFVHIPLPDGEAVGFWVPLEGYPEFFLHFNVGLAINYKTGTPRELAEVVKSRQR
nr:hypothetical protein [Desulfobacula sp.]